MSTMAFNVFHKNAAFKTSFCGQWIKRELARTIFLVNESFKDTELSDIAATHFKVKLIAKFLAIFCSSAPLEVCLDEHQDSLNYFS